MSVQERLGRVAQLELSSLRPEIALSWRRSAMCGLDPSQPELRFDSAAVDRRSRLVAAAQPVLVDLSEQLGEDYQLLLTDRESRIVDAGLFTSTLRTRRLRRRLEQLGVLEGGVFVEETTGTNSIATAHELQRPIAVHGDEHYLESFKDFSCYGHPITHPVTRRLEGVVDVTCLTAAGSTLLAPLLARAVGDIEDRLLDSSRHSEQRLLSAFQLAASRRRPVLVLGEDLTLATPSATALLDPIDHLRLRDLADEGPDRTAAERIRTVTLSSGQRFAVTIRVLAPNGVLYEFGAPDQPPGREASDLTPGSGRTTEVEPAPLADRSASGRRLSPLERAERDAITVALADCDGNKVRAAERLGISRTTLYSRLRLLRIDARAGCSESVQLVARNRS